jgi:hypothetical protein
VDVNDPVSEWCVDDGKVFMSSETAARMTVARSSRMRTPKQAEKARGLLKPNRARITMPGL